MTNQFLLALLLSLTILPTAVQALPPDRPRPIDPGPIDPPEFECISSEDCDDGNPCNGVERCVGTSKIRLCRRGAPPRCNDLDPCTVDRCSLELGGCTHEPDPSCEPPTTTSTTNPPGTTTSTTTQPGSTSTTTTLPPAPGACVPGTTDCDDGDPCTSDECNPDGTCKAVPFTGIAAVTCVCDRFVLPACGSTLPASIERPVTRACLAAEQAESEQGARQRRLLRVVKRAFGKAGARTARLIGKDLVGPDCGIALAAELAEAKTRVQEAQALTTLR